MKLVRRMLLICVVLFFAAIFYSRIEKEMTVTEFILMEGKKSETTGYIIDSGKKGPTVYLVAGIHGNELAGPKTLQALSDLDLSNGRLIVLPEANREAVEEGVRMKASVGDLNRAFPGKIKGMDVKEMAYEIFTNIISYQPDLVIDLHESAYHSEEVKYAYGRSLIFSDVKSMDLVEEAVGYMNERAPKPYVYYYGAKEGTLTEAMTAKEIPCITFEADAEALMDIKVEEQKMFVMFVLEKYEMIR